MIGTQLAAADLEHALPELLAAAAVVAIVPATDLKGWAADMAWEVARAAARGGRRTALVDCFVDAPSLHAAAGAANDEGLVDVFEYGASLNRAVQQQPQANLFFIPAGTFASEPGAVMTNPRWRRLSAGFRHEEALLLLYVAPEHLATLAAEPDGIIVLSPRGLELAVADVPDVMAAVGHGMKVLAVVAEETGAGFEVRGSRADVVAEAEAAPTPEVAVEITRTPHPAPVTPHPAPGTPAPVRRPSAPLSLIIEDHRPKPWGRFMVTAFALAAAVLAILFWQDLRTFVGKLDFSVRRADVAAADANLDSARLPPAPVVAPPAVESLPFAVEVRSGRALPAALALADSLESRRVPAIVAPIRLRGAAAIWHVYAGPYATEARADSALTALRAARTITKSSRASARSVIALSCVS